MRAVSHAAAALAAPASALHSAPSHGGALQEETQEYLDEAKLKELIAKYSEFINFPIYLYASKEVDEPGEEDVEPAAAADSDEVEDEAGMQPFPAAAAIGTVHT